MRREDRKSAQTSATGLSARAAERRCYIKRLQFILFEASCQVSGRYAGCK